MQNCLWCWQVCERTLTPIALKSCGCLSGSSTISLIWASCLRQPPMSSYPTSWRASSSSCKIISKYQENVVRAYKMGSDIQWHQIITSIWDPLNPYYVALASEKGLLELHASLQTLITVTRSLTITDNSSVTTWYYCMSAQRESPEWCQPRNIHHSNSGKPTRIIGICIMTNNEITEKIRYGSFLKKSQNSCEFGATK